MHIQPKINRLASLIVLFQTKSLPDQPCSAGLYLIRQRTGKSFNRKHFKGLLSKAFQQRAGKENCRCNTKQNDGQQRALCKTARPYPSSPKESTHLRLLMDQVNTKGKRCQQLDSFPHMSV